MAIRIIHDQPIEISRKKTRFRNYLSTYVCTLNFTFVNVVGCLFLLYECMLYRGSRISPMRLSPMAKVPGCIGESTVDSRQLAKVLLAKFG